MPHRQAANEDIETRLTAVRVEGMQWLRWFGVVLGSAHVLVVLGTALSRRQLTRDVWVLALAESVVIALAWFVRGRDERVGTGFILLSYALATGGLFHLGFTVGVGSLFVVLCVSTSVFRGRAWGVAAWSLTAATLLAYCLRIEISGVPEAVPYGAIVAPPELALRYSIAILTLSGVATVLVSAVFHGMESTARDLAHALEREREARERQQEMERELARSREFETLGRLAGRVAHDLNNALTPVVTHAEWLRDNAEATAEDKVAAVELASGAKRATALLRELQAFAPKGTLHRHPIALDRAIALALEEVLAETPANVQITRTLGAGNTCVLAEEALLALAVKHLVSNALEAMPEGGELTVATTCDKAAGLVEISVTDTGLGMSAATLARMFDPFFTTRSGAAGLGLAIVFGITKSHDGTVESESNLARGTTVRIRLPIVEAAVARGPRPEIREPKALVIDDDEGVRRVVVRTLERLGFRCDEASNGLDGLAGIERDHATLSLVIVDSIMPGLRGEEVFARAREVAPKLAVLMISGHLSTGEDPAIPYDEHAGFLAKPFATTDLKRAVEALVLVRANPSPSPSASRSGAIESG